MQSRSVGPLLFALCVTGCSGAPAPEAGYTEGRVEVAGNNVTVGSRPLPAALGTDVAGALRTLQGLDVGVAFRGTEADILSPVNDQWRAFADKVDVPDDVDPRVRPLWSATGTEARATFPDQQQLEDLTAAYRSVEGPFAQVKTTGRALDPKELSQLRKDYELLETSAYHTASFTTDTAQQELLIRIALESQRKAIVLASYPDSILRGQDFLEAMLRNGKGAVAITRDKAVIGTGFLVSSTWLITNRHVLAGISDLTNALTIAFEGLKPPAGVRGTTCAIVDHKVADSQSPLDVAALRFRCAAQNPPLWKDRILRMANRNTTLNEGLYVVGYQGGPTREFADNVKVRYPFRVTDQEHTGLRRGELTASARQLFDQFYQRCDAATTDWCYQSSLDRWGGGGNAVNIPTIGFDSNTGPNNSGSPVFSGQDHAVVGVFFGGAADHQNEVPYSFERHEAALPSPLVLAWLKKEKILP